MRAMFVSKFICITQSCTCAAPRLLCCALVLSYGTILCGANISGEALKKLYCTCPYEVGGYTMGISRFLVGHTNAT